MQTRATSEGGNPQEEMTRWIQEILWDMPYETIQSRIKERPHHSSFPVELPEMCIRLHGVTPFVSLIRF